MPITSDKGQLGRPSRELQISRANFRVADQWSKNAKARAHQIKSGKDLSREHIIVPTMLEAIGPKNYERVLDIGTGDGDFLARLKLANVANRYIGIDVSEKMIDIAHSEHSDILTDFFILEGERALEIFGQESFDLVTANMVLNTAPNLDGIIASAAKVLIPNGLFVFSILHPRFFHLQAPMQNYLPADFDYSKESAFETPFTITLDQKPLPSNIMYYHRPLTSFLYTLAQYHLTVVDLIEPIPPKDLDPQYLITWKMPRFLVFKTQKDISK